MPAPAAFKLTNFAILHAHKPYKLLANLSPAADSRKNPGLRIIAGWWCRITPLQNPAHVSTTTSPLRCRIHGQNLCFYASDSRSEGKYGYFDRGGNNDSLRNQMGAAVNAKVETARDESDVSPPRKPPGNSTKLLTLPTILTIGRVAAVPFLVCTFYTQSSWGPAATVGIFVAAATTDWLDGYLARKMKMGTQFGAFLDPVADKLMVATTLILLCTEPFETGMFAQAPWVLTVPATAIICREITMSAVREWAASRDRNLLEAVAVNNLGKWKTATQMTALTILLAARDGSLAGDGTLVSSGVVLLYISAWLSLWSMIVYMRKIWRVLIL